MTGRSRGGGDDGRRRRLDDEARPWHQAGVMRRRGGRGGVREVSNDAMGPALGNGGRQGGAVARFAPSISIQIGGRERVAWGEWVRDRGMGVSGVIGQGLGWLAV